MPFLVYDCSCVFVPSLSSEGYRCSSCGSGGVSDTINSLQWIEANQRIIQNQVRAPASQYTGSLAAATVRGPVVGALNNNPIASFGLVNWNQSSDRAQPSTTDRFVPSRGNSTRTSLTRCRPGAACPGGKNANGVDVKHNSYDRFLARKKAGAIRQKEKIPTGTYAEKAYYTKYSLVQNSACKCEV